MSQFLPLHWGGFEESVVVSNFCEKSIDLLDSTAIRSVW